MFKYVRGGCARKELIGQSEGELPTLTLVVDATDGSYSGCGDVLHIVRIHQ